MRRFLTTLLSPAAALLLAACGAASDAPENTAAAHIAAMAQTEGCQSGPAAQFGRYIGDWDIQDWQLSREDGKTWLPQKGARWQFVCVGDGVAVQDFWHPNAGGTGTNLRMYDPKTEQWDIAWTATGAPGFTHISAVQNEAGAMVMTYISPKQTPPRRITFFPPDKDGWDWLMEMSMDEGASWTGVYKIRATPRGD